MTKSEEKEAMLLYMVQGCGLALSLEEKKELEKAGWVDTEKYNGHGQPLVKNVRTGEVLSVCRSYPVMSSTCNFYCSNLVNDNPCGIAH
jgi:hypothetical protein